MPSRQKRKRFSIKAARAEAVNAPDGPDLFRDIPPASDDKPDRAKPNPGAGNPTDRRKVAGGQMGMLNRTFPDDKE